MGRTLDFFNYTKKALYLSKNKKFDEAIIYFSKALEIRNDAKTFYNLGLALFNLNKFEEAITNYDNCISINPDIKDAYHNKALALYNLKRYDEAISCYEFLANKYNEDRDKYNKIINGIKSEISI